jgi:hypothetical protein
MTIVPVPETAMHEDYGLVLGKHKVRFSRQSLVMEKKAKALCMQAAPDD